jgi:hypothetical protein
MSIQNILYLRGPDGSLRPVITASGHWIPAVLVPGTPLLSAVMAAEKKAAEDKKKAEEAKKKADEKRKRLAKVSFRRL